MLWTYLPVLAMIIGLVLYFAVKNNPDVKEVGRLAYGAGLLLTLWEFAGHAIRLG